jgi:hypothetical protein
MKTEIDVCSKDIVNDKHKMDTRWITHLTRHPIWSFPLTHQEWNWVEVETICQYPGQVALMSGDGADGSGRAG